MISLGFSRDRWSFAGFCLTLKKYVGASTVACTNCVASACAYPCMSGANTLKTPSLDGRGSSTPLWSPVIFEPSDNRDKRRARAKGVGVPDVFADALCLPKAATHTAGLPLWAVLSVAALALLIPNFPLNCERKTSHV